MTTFSKLALLFIGVPLLELVLLLQVGSWIGLWPTLAIVIGTGFLGAALARAEGMRTLVAFQAEVQAGRLPGQAIQDGLAVLIGGALLLTPGLITDLTGFSLLFLPTRRVLQRWIRSGIRRKIEDGQVQVGVYHGDVFHVETFDRDDSRFN